MKNKLSLITALCLITLYGCASTQDLRQLRGELAYKSDSTDEKIANLHQMTDSLQQAMEKNNEILHSLRRGQADSGAAIAELRDHVQQLRGALDTLRKDSATGPRTSRREEELKEIREQLDTVAFKIRYLENFLGLGLARKEEQPEPAEKGKTAVTPAKATAPKGGKTDRESLYASALAAFKAGQYDKARTEFQNFLKLHPDSEFSDNAQFWIAESFYFENRFDLAIPEYEKVIKNYPHGAQVARALLKLGFAHLSLGDRVRARAILQQVIKDYPNTGQARTARLRLLEIK